jgi:PAS domain S-box-containing protein
MDSLVLISETDSKGIIKYINKQYSIISGYGKDELVGSDFSLLRNHSIPSKFYEVMWDRLNNNRVWNGTVSNRNKKGSSYWLNSTIYRKDEDTFISISTMANRKDIELAKKYLEKISK